MPIALQIFRAAPARVYFFFEGSLVFAAVNRVIEAGSGFSPALGL